MKRFKLLAVVLGLVTLTTLPLAGISPSLAQSSTCGGIGVIWLTSQLPVGTMPSFTIAGPSVTLQSTSYQPTIPGNISIGRGPSGQALPGGTYTITVNSIAGGAQIKSINGRTGNTYAFVCDSGNFGSYSLDFTPVTNPGGNDHPAIRITPSSAAINTASGSNLALFDAEYSPNGSSNWQNVTPGAIWTSSNEQALRYEGQGHLKAEFRGVAAATVPVSAVYAGLTATANVTVTLGNIPPPPVITAPCQGIVVESNLPTNWQITGPASVQSPNYPQLTTGATVTQQPGGGAFPSGNYTITVPATVPGGQNPTITAGGFGTLGTTSGSLDCPGIWLHFGIRYAGTNPSGTDALQYVKTVLNMKANDNGAAQGITQGAFLNNHFVFRGLGCSEGIHGVASLQSGGGGLWSFPEDGSAVQERQMCLDGGAASNIIYHHGENEGQMFTDGSTNFVFTNSTWGACVSNVIDNTGACAVNGPGATKSVYYGWEGGQVVIKSVSPRPDESVNGDLSSGWAVTPNGYAVGPLTVTKLSDWSRAGSSQVASLLSFGGYFLGRPSSGSQNGVALKVYKLQGTEPVLVGDLPGNIQTFGNAYAIDPSKASPELVIYDLGRAPTGPVKQPRLLRYKVGSNGLDLVSEITLDSKMFPDTPRAPGNFGAWGDYIFWPVLSQGGGGNVIVAKLSGSSYSKVQTLTLPNAGNPGQIITSKGGYVAIAPYATDANVLSAGGVAVYLYKIGGGTPPPNPCDTNPNDPSCNPGGGTTTLPQVIGQTFNITFSTTTAGNPRPDVLTRFAYVTSVASSSLDISVFGRDYHVDASDSEIVDVNWRATTLAAFGRGGFANVWGTLDLANSALIHASRVRNPLPAGAAGPQSFTAQNAVFIPDTVVVTPQANTTIQANLSVLQQALQALQLRLGQ